MEIAVVGGTGTFGRLAVAELDRRGHAVRVLSRNAPEGEASAHRRVDLATGEGLREALEGVEVVLDAANSGGRKQQTTTVLIEGTRRLLAAGAEAGVRHHALISIVGIEAVPVSYYRAKVDQERLVRGGPLPASILRATQFHQLIDQILEAFARFRILPRWSLLFQPVDPREVAVAMADSIEAGPSEERREVAGPEVHKLGELARIRQSTSDRRCWQVPMPLFGAAPAAARRGALCAPDAPQGSVTFERWLKEGRGEQEPAGSETYAGGR